MKGKALKRALQTNDIVRIGGDIPLLTDTTEVISPNRAYELLESNKKNRPINWRRVEEYASIMKRGEWKVHGQGLMLDVKGNILTGQHRLWGVIYADVAVPMRISRGNPEDVAHLIDRGIPQSARDLAARESGRKHSPQESSLARGILACRGLLKPNTDELAEAIVQYQAILRTALTATQGIKKTPSILMVLSAICVTFGSKDTDTVLSHVAIMDQLTVNLENRLSPQTSKGCWNRGAAFGLAMQQAIQCVSSKDA